MIHYLLDPLLALLFPQLCSSCGGHVERMADGAACRGCWAAVKSIGDTDTLCTKCGAFLLKTPEKFESTCGRCNDHHYDIARSAGVYEGALKATVLSMKSQPALPRTARERLLEAFRQLKLRDDTVIMPVPLSRQRSLERGFNQAELLAEAVARTSGFRIDAFSLVRTKDTPMHRAAMDAKARERRVKNAFEVVRSAFVKGRDILLVDDLMTSGSTASQCAKALKKSGAGRVLVLTLARAELRG